MRARGLVYGYGRQTFEQHQPTLDTFPPWINKFAASAGLPAPADAYKLVEEMYFSNFFVSRVDWWTLPDVQVW